MVQGGFRLLLSCLIVFNSLQAFASAPAGIDHPCAPSKELSLEEHSSILMFNAKLSWLADYYGKPNFNAKLTDIVQKSWPKTTLVESSPYFIEKVINMMDQARLKNSIALTIGFDGTEWDYFERYMKQITLMGSTGGMVNFPLPKVAEMLMRKIAASTPVAPMNAKTYESIKAEAIARTVGMNTFMMKWQALNREIQNEEASANAKKVAVIGLGLVGVGVLASTFVLASPAWVAGGTAGAALGSSLSVSPAVAMLMANMGRIASGSLMGIMGGPATVGLSHSVSILSKANAASLNNQSLFSCELSKQIKVAQSEAPSQMLLAAAVGGVGGAVGTGMILANAKLAKVVTHATVVAIAAGSSVAVYQLGDETWSSMSDYRKAQAAAEAGDINQAKAFLMSAREHAVVANEKFLETLIMASLVQHTAAHLVHSLKHGSEAMGVFYASASDTVPSAVKSTIGVMPFGARPGLAQACDGTSGSDGCSVGTPMATATR